jgi:predicted esterase
MNILKKGIICFVFFGTFFHKTTAQEPVFIFVHGIFNSSLQGRSYRKFLESLGYRNFIVFNFKDAFYFPFLHRIHKPLESSLGQESDIEQLNKIYENVVYAYAKKNLPIPPIIMIGISLGAAIILNFLGAKKPKFVRAAICESPFDTTRTIVQTRFSGKKAFIGSRFYQLFKNHNPDGIQPIKSVKQIPYHISLLLLASEPDTSVPLVATERLYQALLKNGHQKVMLHVFNKGRHARLLRYNQKEYTHAIQTFLIKTLA